MLYLRTGANGSCKTLFTLWDVRKLQVESGRPVAWNGRFKLKPEKEEEFGWKRIEFKDWQAEPDGTIFLIDECHNDLPKRASSAVVPEPVKMLAEHRARGFDFFLLTQHPMNVDDFVRRLVGAPGWHQHLKRVFGGTNVTRVVQWDAVNPQCEKNGSGKTGEVTTRTQPKEVYGWYESASLHTAKVRIPKALIVLAVAAVLVPAVGFLAYQKLVPKVADKPLTATGTPMTANGSAPAERRPATAAEYVASYQPRVAGLMHTAPVYDRLTEPKRVPVAAACVSMPSKGCKCFTQDATPYPMTEAMCRGIVEHGAFLAFQAEGERAAKVEHQKAQQAVKSGAGEVREMGPFIRPGETVADPVQRVAGRP